MGKRKKEKALTDAEEIVKKLVSEELKRAKDIYAQKKKKEIEEFHNKVVEAIETVNPDPSTVVFVLEIVKEEVLRQFLLNTVKKNE